MKLTVKAGRENKIHIMVDDEYHLTVDSDFWYSEKWHNLKNINEEELTALEDAVSFRRAYNAGLNILTFRDHGKKELEKKLVSKKFSKEAAEKATERLEELGLLNDENFAERLSKELYNRKAYSPKRIRQELISRGIDREICEIVIQKLDNCDEVRIIELLNTKYLRYLSDEKGRKKVYNTLLRLGYSYSDINCAFRNFEDNNNLL